ncbi:MAG: extracellular solute-binding protein [Clostridia bacterium]|nr:extracellular solute-binding protein [Clostridia bacterium]
MKKITALLLAALMVLVCAAAVGCADNNDPAISDDTEDVTTVEEVVETDRLPDPVPTSLDLGGETVTFLVIGEGFNGTAWRSQDIFEEEDSDDPIKAAVFRRNMTLQDKYHCVIAEEVENNTSGKAKTSINSGADDYQVLMCDTGGTLALAQANLLRDLNALEGLDMKNPWWDQNLVANCSIGGKLFFATGDISIMDNDATWVMMFNKKLITDLDLESPYDLVRNNQWTYDKMYEMMTQAKRDENGNGKVDWDIDSFGFATHNSSLGAFYYAAGLKVVEKDADDMPYFPEQATEYVNLVLDKSIKLWTDKTLTWSADRDGYGAVELQKIFEEGRALFLGEVMQLVFRLREMQIDFGLIPFPKYNSEQKNYGHFVHATSAMLSIPVSCKKVDKIAPFVEAMAYESMYTLTPAYYETALTGKYFRDPESNDMLTIILQSRTFDLGSTHMFNWGNMAGSFTELLAKGSDAYASTYAKRIKSAKKALEKDLKRLLK